MFESRKKHNSPGFTLIEALVGTAIFVILILSVYQAYLTTSNVARLSRIKTTATALANEQFEIMRNLPYSDVGIVSGLPKGKIPAKQELIRDNKNFTVKTTVRNIDDPFDGTIGGTPNDISPADYKMAELEITCATCQNFSPLYLTTYIAPRNLENSSTNGAIFVKVFDAVGLPVPGADVHIENNQTIPTFMINDTTNNDGLLQIVDAPPEAQAYEISVSKDGYTSDQTYENADPANPEPSKPHATVLAQQLTQISFNIDKVSTLEISSVNNICAEVGDVNFTLTGEKLIGTNIHKYNESHATDSVGSKIIEDLEWDTYNITFTDTVYDLAGIIPSTTFTINPDSAQNLKLIVTPKNAKSLLFIVRDSYTGLLLADANIQLTGNEYASSTVTTTEDTCLPAGQAFFSGLLNTSYNVIISKTGYGTFTGSANTSLPWQQKEITLIPE